ncbi:MAG: hypothetical protein J7K61_03500 [Thermoplasmata archaeon]|nr:hypothetical protein [Thermoplasmata archaeon]
MSEENIELQVGAKYVIHSVSSDKECMTTSGTFVGYTYIGKEEGGICIKMDSSHGKLKGKIRIIPIGMILAIDVMVNRRKKKKKEEKEEEAMHYFS